MKLECANCGAIFQPAGTPTKCDILRLESLLRDNRPLTSVENSTISRLESSIDEYDRIIMSLQNQQMELKRRASRYGSLLAPIRKIPPEILLLILQIACSSNSLAKPAYEHQKRQLVTVNVGQVCNYWRNLVMSNEELWSTLGNLQIGDAGLDGDDPELPLLMQTYLSRSGSRPLTFTLNLGGDEIGPTADRIAQCSSRWGDVTLSRVAREDWNIGPRSEGFPVLKSLSIHVHSFFLPLNTFKVAPHLHTLILTDMEELEPGFTDFPWRQLRYLELDSPSVAMCEEVLPLCTQLSHLHLDLPRSSRYVNPLVFNASMKLQISSLSLTIFDEVAGSFFTSVTLPALTSLKLTPFYIDKPKRTNLIPIQGIRSCLSRSQCTVTKITIGSYSHLTIPDVVLVDYLCLFPAATHLVLEDVTISGTFIEHLNPLTCPSSNILLPNLLTLELLSGDQLPFNYETFVDLLKARWNPSMHDTMAQIRAVSLLNECDRASFDPALLPTLRVLNKSGMSITIVDGEGLVFGPVKLRQILCITHLKVHFPGQMLNFKFRVSAFMTIHDPYNDSFYIALLEFILFDSFQSMLY